ncbi:uncharacterized protein A4U43_C04F25580, partial [Asparagus officinalis]
LTAEAAIRIATRMVYEAEYQKRKGKEPACPSSNREQGEDTFLSGEEGLDADIILQLVYERLKINEPHRTTYSEPVVAQTTNLGNPIYDGLLQICRLAESEGLGSESWLGTAVEEEASLAFFFKADALEHGAIENKEREMITVTSFN